MPGSGGFKEHDLKITHGDEDWRTKIHSHVRHYLYPIHTSKLFLSTPTLSSALYLLLVRFLSGQYDRVFLLTRFCLKDVPLSSEERQIVNQLHEVQYDRHPNAIACRLQLRMVTRGTPMESDLPFESLPQEYFSYLSVLPHITARCRLTIREELTCARLASNAFDRSNDMYEDVSLSEDQLCVLENRREFLECCVNKSKSMTIELKSPQPYESINNFNEEIDRTVLQDENQLTSIISKLSTISYSRPKDSDLHSLLALQHLNRYLQNGLSLRGGSDSPGFLFLYELMTNHLKMKLLPDDSSFNWGALLTRYLPIEERKKKSLYMSILRMLTFNKELSKSIPKYEDNRRFKFSTVFRGQNVIQRLMSGIKQHVKEKDSEIRWPQPSRVLRFSPRADFKMDSLDSLRDQDRTLVAVRVEDTSREILSVKQAELEGGLRLNLDEFVVPLSALCSEFTKESSSSEIVRKEMEFLTRLEKHPRAKSRAAANIITRVSEDLKHYSDVASTAKEEVRE